MHRSGRMRILTVSALFALLLGCATPAPEPVPTPTPAAVAASPCDGVKDPVLCAELIAMRDRDQAVRKKWIADRDNEAVKQEVEAVDRENTTRVRAIIDAQGWPGKSIVGEKGSAAAWTLLQHADAATLKQYIAIMERAVDGGELHGSLFATSVDRVRIQEGRPQVYGSQFHEVDGKMVPLPIENEEEVDARRAKVGLGPLAEYSKMLNEAYARPKKP